jgi:hypothetical protein
MTIIENAERYMKRYDYLIAKRERRYKQGKRLTPEEDEELLKLRPNVFTPILVMFELLHDTVKSNQTLRKQTNHHASRQSGGASNPEPEANAAEANAAAIAAVAVATSSKDSDSKKDATSADPKKESEESKESTEDADADADETQRLSQLEESLMPLLTKIIVYIEQNKKNEKKKEEEDEEEKYPDIGTSAKNSAILVIRRIKKWWNDLISGGTSDLSSKINLKKAIPQLANNDADMNKLNELADKVITAVDDPLQKIAKVLSNDVRDIASSSVEGIMNALSLIPGIGTTLQLWRLLQNVIVIMSKSVTTMAGAKTEGVALKTNVMGLKDELAGAAAGMAAGAVQNAAQNATASVMDSAGIKQPELQAGLTPPTGLQAAGLTPSNPLQAAGLTPSNPLQAASVPAGLSGMMGGAATTKPPTNHLRSTKKYKREYKESLREIKKTRKKLLKYIKNMI